MSDDCNGKTPEVQGRTAHRHALEKMHPNLCGQSRLEVGQRLRYVDAVLLPVLALNGLHLIFEA
jgi:hypothetical protein